MTTAMDYTAIEGRVSASFTATSSPLNTTQVNAYATDADTKITLETGDSTLSTTRELLVKEAMVAYWQDFYKNRLASGGNRVMGIISAELPQDPWAEYNKMRDLKYPKRQTESRGFLLPHFGKHPTSSVQW